MDKMGDIQCHVQPVITKSSFPHQEKQSGYFVAFKQNTIIII